MSSKKTKAEKKAPQTLVEAPRRPSGKVPEAVVSSRHGVGIISRLGKGFSYAELSAAGLAPRTAMDWGARVDPRRRSMLDGNVSALRGWGGHLGVGRKAEGRVKKAEEVLAKAEKEVVKEAVEVKEEVVKAGRAAKKEAGKAEKAVKARAKPKKKAEA